MKNLRIYLILIIAVTVSLSALLGPILNYISFTSFSIITFTLIGLLQVVSSIDFFKSKNIKIAIISAIGSIACAIIVLSILIK